MAHFVATSPAAAARLRGDPAAVAALREGPREETSLDVYWHGVQYLITGRAKGVRGPLAWLTGGGEKLGRTPGGPVRYLSPDQVAQLAAALDDVEPDDLGDDTWDEAAMDKAGVYPGRWVRDGRDCDKLGTVRELYSYVRSFMARQHQAGTGVAIVMTLEPRPDDDEDEEVEPPAPVEPPRAAAPADPAAVLLVGAKGRRYDRAQGTPQPALDAEFAGFGYQPLGDMAVLPVLEGGVVRTYRSTEGTSVAAVVINPDRGAVSTTFFSLLAKDAILVVSNAFVLEKAKRKLFATTSSKAAAAQLDATLRERRAALQEKFGAPVFLPAELGSAARVWEAWWARHP